MKTTSPPDQDRDEALPGETLPGPGGWRDGALRAGLERLEKHPPLAVAKRLLQLLRYLFEETVAGRGGRISQYTIAFECFGIDATDFDPNRSATVRVHLSRLRKILDDYAAGSGSVRITLPVGTYSLKFSEQVTPKPGLPRQVLAFIDFNGSGLDGEWALLPHLLTEQISDRVSRVHAFDVMGPFPRNLAGSGDPDLTAVSRKYGIACFVDGSVNRRGDRVDLRLRTIDGPTGTVTWTASETLPIKHLAREHLGSELLERLAAGIGADFGAIDAHFGRLSRTKPEHALSIHEAVLLGRMYFFDYNPRSLPVAVRRLRQVVLECPDEALPKATLAMLLANAGHEGAWPELPPAAEIQSLADDAWRLDPMASWSILARGFACCFSGDLPEIRRLAQAVETDPDASVLSICGLGVLLCLQNLDLPQGLRMIHQARRMSPYQPRAVDVVEALVSLRAGDLDATLAHLDRYGIAWGWAAPLLRGAVHALRGDLESAACEHRAVMAAYPDFGNAALEPGRMAWHADHLRFLLDIYHRVGIGGVPCGG
jgi:TolB-like protein